MSANSTARIGLVLDASEGKTEARAMSKELDNIGDAGKRAGVSASAGLSQVEQATKAAGVTSTQSLRAFETEIANTRAELALLNQRILESTRNTGANSAATRELKAAYQDLSASLRITSTEKAGLNLIAKEDAASAKAAAAAAKEEAAARQPQAMTALEAARAEQALALANTETAAASEMSTRQMLLTAGAASRVAGAAIPGARSLGVLSGAMGSMGFVQLAVIAGIGILLGELFKLGKATEEVIRLDEEGLKIDAERSVAMHTGTLFTKERATVMHDFIASNVALGQALDDLKRKEQAEEAARRAATESLVSQKASASEVSLLFGVLGQTTEQLTKKEAEATAARIEATAAVHKQVESYIRLALETHLSAQATIEMAQHTRAEKDVLDALTVALDSAYFATLRFKSGQNLISETRFKVAFDAAKAGETLNHAEAQRRYNAELAKGGDETVRLAHETELAQKNLSAFNETHHRGGAAARAYANELVNLRKQALDAVAALGGDSFTARDAKIANDLKAEREHLAINKRDRQEALEWIAVREKAMHDKVAQDRAVAEQRLRDEIRDIDIAGIQDAVEREEAAIKHVIGTRGRAIYQEFGVTETSEQLVLEMKEGYGRRLERFYVEQGEKRLKQYEQMIRAEERTEKDLTIAIQEEETKRAVIILKGAAEAARARNEARKFLFSQGQDASSGGVDRFLNQLKELGPAFQDVDKNAATTKTAIDYVRNAFDFSSHSAEVFQLKLDRLTHHSISFGQVFKAVFAEMFLNVQAATAFFEGFGQAISSVFEGLVTGTQNAKAAFLNFIATILAQMGSMAIAIGTIFLFIPGYGGLGAGLIAAGIAAMALSGVFRGLAQNAQKQSQQGAGTSTGTAGGSTAPANGPAPPNVTQFPTSGPLSGGPVTNVFKLDYQGTKDFLAGRVVTQEALNNPNSPEVRKIKKHARAS